MIESENCMNLESIKERYQAHIRPAVDADIDWLIAEVEGLRSIRRLTITERRELEKCREAIDLYKRGKCWYPLQLRQAELLLAYLDRLTGQESQQETSKGLESTNYNYPPNLGM